MVSSDVPSPDPDSLAGSPELFATNLLIVRGIDHGIDAIEIRRSDAAITVQLLAGDRSFEEEVLTEETNHWDSIRERFRSMTEPSDDPGALDRLHPKTPATDSVEKIEVDYPDHSSIKLHFSYPDDD